MDLFQPVLLGLMLSEGDPRRLHSTLGPGRIIRRGLKPWSALRCCQIGKCYRVRASSLPIGVLQRGAFSTGHSVILSQVSVVRPENPSWRF